MKHFFAHLIIAAAVFCEALNPFRRGHLSLANTITISQEFVETHHEAITLKSDDTVSARDLLFATGSDAKHIQIAAADQQPLGTVDNKTLVAEDHAALLLLAGTKTRRMVASGAISAGVPVYTDAGGKVQAEPTVAGTYYLIGVSLSASLADGDTIEVLANPVPTLVRVIALLGNVNSEISALTSSANTTQAEFNALRDKCEELADDVRALGAALTVGGLVRVLAA